MGVAANILQAAVLDMAIWCSFAVNDEAPLQVYLPKAYSPSGCAHPVEAPTQGVRIPYAPLHWLCCACCDQNFALAP